MQGSALHRSVPVQAENHGILGESVEMKKITEVIEQVAPTDITVLVTGESGVGKEVIARAIYAASNRSKKPFITVNSAAIPEGIIESELFGHERGSFTGASEQRKGYFELADGGTIFLDEIGEMPLSAQVKFLRVLENGEFLRVGSSTPRRVNVRVIAATNKDLETEVRNNRFRMDLFYRLRSVNIHVPPLRNRPGDIPVLFRHFVEEFTQKNNVKFGGISDEALHLLQTYHWPGNVRELRNVVESMLVIESGKRIEAENVSRYLKDFPAFTGERNLPVPMNKSVEQAERELILRALFDIKSNILELRDLLAERLSTLETPAAAAQQAGGLKEAENIPSLKDVEKNAVKETLERFNYNRRAAARALNISERTLYRKIRDFGL